MDVKRSYNKLGIRTRGLALCSIIVFLVGTLIGSMASESGNILVGILNISQGQVYNPFHLSLAHVFNPIFLILGIAGVSVALFLGFTRSR